MAYIYVLFGLVLLAIGGEAIVRGGVRLAKTLKLSRLMVGLFFLSFAMSSPELAVALQANFNNQPDMVLGAIIGSNIANLLLMLALPAFFAPILYVEDRVLRVTLVMVVVSLGFMVILELNALTRLTGVGLIVALGIYLYLTYYLERRSADFSEDGATGFKDASLPVLAGRASSISASDGSETFWSKFLPFGLERFAIGIGLLASGVACLFFGAEYLLEGAVEVARTFKVPESVIALSIVAVGTSLPELATVIVAGIRKQAEMAIGSIIGSNIFNILAVLGITAIFEPIPIATEFVNIDMWVMLAASLCIIPFVATDWKIGRIEASVMLISYVGYIAARYAGESLLIYF